MKYWSVFICLALFAMLSAGCIKSNCQDTVCANDGVCVQGNCSCVAGYEGEGCSILWTEKFVGNWQATDIYATDTAKHNYNLIISSIAKDTFLISGLADTLNNILCVRDTRFTFKVLATSIQDSTYVIKDGAAMMNVSANTVTGLYSFSLNDSVITTNFTWKQ